MKIRNVLLAAVAALSAVPALAQIAVGATINDQNGGSVGTVSAIQGDAVVVKTDKYEIGLPSASFTRVDNAFIIGMTQANLNAAYEQTMAQAQQLVVVGATVRGPQGNPVGTIAELDTEFATLQLAGTDQKVRLPRASIGATPQGPVIALTPEQIQAQVGAAAPAAEAPAAN